MQKKNRVLILGPKTNFFSHFGHNKNFPQKLGSLTLTSLIKPNFMQKKKKKKKKKEKGNA